ncbi:MAG: YggT family protein [Nitrincola sp.]|nr:YggT family protein [Nitrincola sp.]
MVRRVIPPIGGLDLSPIAIFLIIQIIQSQLPRLM